MKTNRPFINIETKRKVLEKYDYHCAYCGCCIKDRACIDHIVPYDAGGSSEIDNLNPACPKCNNWKFTFSIEQFRMELSKQVDRARKYSRNFLMAERYGLVKETKEPVVFYFEKLKAVSEA